MPLSLTLAQACSLLEEADWERVVTLATAYAFQNQIAVGHGSEKVVTALPNINPIREDLLGLHSEDRHHVSLQNASLEHPCNAGERSDWDMQNQWIVYFNKKGTTTFLVSSRYHLLSQQ